MGLPEAKPASAVSAAARPPGCEADAASATSRSRARTSTIAPSTFAVCRAGEYMPRAYISEACGTAPVARSARGGALDLDDLLVGRAVHPVDQGLRRAAHGPLADGVVAPLVARTSLVAADAVAAVDVAAGGADRLGQRPPQHAPAPAQLAAAAVAAGVLAAHLALEHRAQ